MRNFGVIHIATLVILTLVVVGCEEEEVPTYENEENEEEELSSQPENEAHDAEEIEKEPPEPVLPLPIGKVIDKLEKAIEEGDLELYLEAFWTDDYSYRSDMSTDDPADDVMFDHIKEELDSTERLFDAFHAFEVEFKTEQFVEVDGAEIEVRSQYELVASVPPGTSLPGGHQKVFAKGSNLFTFKERGGKWRISRWEQEEMSRDEVEKAMAEAVIELFPPEGALIMNWGMLKA